MDRVIAKLQRERWYALRNVEHFATALAERKAEASELELAIDRLGGDASVAACQEAEEAWQRKVNAQAQQETATFAGGQILGR